MLRFLKVQLALSFAVGLAVHIACAIAVAADAPAAVPSAVSAAPSIVEWFKAYLPIILGVALSISELLSVTPWFKGNGILDSVVKSLRYLTGKQADQGQQ